MEAVRSRLSQRERATPVSAAPDTLESPSPRVELAPTEEGPAPLPATVDMAPPLPPTQEFEPPTVEAAVSFEPQSPAEPEPVLPTQDSASVAEDDRSRVHSTLRPERPSDRVIELDETAQALQDVADNLRRDHPHAYLICNDNGTPVIIRAELPNGLALDVQSVSPHELHITIGEGDPGKAATFGLSNRRFAGILPLTTDKGLALQVRHVIDRVDAVHQELRMLDSKQRVDHPTMRALRKQLAGWRQTPCSCCVFHTCSSLKGMREWMHRQRPRPGSALAKAIIYTDSRWQQLTLFVEDPEIWLDNNGTERALRGPVIGRKNHYGSRSDNGMRAAAVFYSLLETCQRLGIDARSYLGVALARLAGRECEAYTPSMYLAESNH